MSFTILDTRLINWLRTFTFSCQIHIGHKIIQLSHWPWKTKFQFAIININQQKFQEHDSKFKTKCYIIVFLGKTIPSMIGYCNKDVIDWINWNMTSNYNETINTIKMLHNPSIVHLKRKSRNCPLCSSVTDVL